MEAPRYTIASEPIEVWLRQGNLEVTCTVVYEDESTDEGVSVNSMSMRGAQREITGYLIAEGYTPVGRWAAEAADGDAETIECWRRFRPAASAALAGSAASTSSATGRLG